MAGEGGAGRLVTLLVCSFLGDGTLPFPPIPSRTPGVPALAGGRWPVQGLLAHCVTLGGALNLPLWNPACLLGGGWGRG